MYKRQVVICVCLGRLACFGVIFFHFFAALADIEARFPIAGIEGDHFFKGIQRLFVLSQMVIGIAQAEVPQWIVHAQMCIRDSNSSYEKGACCFMGNPSVHPTGTIIYKPEKCYNGYTIFPAVEHGATLIDMNGGVVNHWHDLQGFPNKLLPGGQVFGSLGERSNQYGWQDQLDLVQVDWDGNIVWKFDHSEYIEDADVGPRWAARQHHDFQREEMCIRDSIIGTEGLGRIHAHIERRILHIAEAALFFVQLMGRYA